MVSGGGNGIRYTVTLKDVDVFLEIVNVDDNNDDWILCGSVGSRPKKW